MGETHQRESQNQGSIRPEAGGAGGEGTPDQQHQVIVEPEAPELAGTDNIVPQEPHIERVAVPDRALSRASLLRFLPAAILVVGLVAALLAGVDDYLTLAALAEHRAFVLETIDGLGWMAGFAYAGLTMLVAAFSIPAIAVMNVTAGFLFGAVVGTAFATVGQTLGALVVYYASKNAFRSVLERRAGPAVKRMEAGFKNNALSYMLLVRFMPMFPAWLINLVPGLLGVPVRIFAIGTFFGVIPCTFVFASVGSGLGAVIDAGETPSLAIFLEPHILFPLLALVLIAASPALYRMWRNLRAGRSAVRRTHG